MVTPENPNNQEVRRFNLNDVSVTQQGRIFELSHPISGVTYLVDMTERSPEFEEDVEAGFASEDDAKLNQMGRRFAALYHLESYAQNNGVVSVISRRLNKDDKPGMYSGLASQEELGEGQDEDEEAIVNQKSTYNVLDKAGFKYGEFNVPMSADPEVMEKELKIAINEIGARNCVFPDLVMYAQTPPGVPRDN